ncbi:carbohydrate-binding protein [Phascolarctobacterium faecium]|uniref:carbohydrate-binding protein n=1 Tax=Phascolarctobacterium faecium TaxID=33025 RepID=UPI000F0C8BDC|nr:carbohydrate-binding protein [Phascolarctobacterium faecium]BBG64276.1 Carbohydrate binding domain protein [Phascolarctobacterium faecium]DAY82961.1 MAG TPA: ChiA1-BD-binding domain protein [Caudoviricetes sp.]
MVCVVNEENVIIGMINLPYPIRDNEKIYHPWNALGEQYTDVEPEEFKNKREASVKQEKLKNLAFNALIKILNGSSELTTLQRTYQQELNNVPDNLAQYIPSMYPAWNPNGIEYKKDQRVQYNGILYKVLTAHTSQESWKPDVSPSLFVKVISSIAGEIPEWQQPTTENAYMKGDKVRCEGKIYESLIDNNVWKPTEYPQGWKDITNEIGAAS